MEKIALVTGASKGIGRACAKELAKNGIKVIANYNKSEDMAKKLKEELLKENIEIDIYKTDVGNKEEIKTNDKRYSRKVWKNRYINK